MPFLLKFVALSSWLKARGFCLYKYLVNFWLVVCIYNSYHVVQSTCSKPLVLVVKSCILGFVLYFRIQTRYFGIYDIGIVQDLCGFWCVNCVFVGWGSPPLRVAHVL